MNLNDLEMAAELGQEAMAATVGGEDKDDVVYIFSADVLKELQPAVGWITDAFISNRQAEDEALENLNNTWGR